jgi:hypothetical protein
VTREKRVEPLAGLIGLDHEASLLYGFGHDAL